MNISRPTAVGWHPPGLAGTCFWIWPSILALHQDACTQHCTCRISIEKGDAIGSGLTTVQKTSMKSRIYIMLTGVSPMTARRVAPEKRPHQRKNHESFLQKMVRASFIGANAVPQRSGPRTKTLGQKATDTRVSLAQQSCPSTPRQTQTSGAQPRPPPFAGNGRTAQLCPTTAHNLRWERLVATSTPCEGTPFGPCFSNTTLNEKKKDIIAV